MTTTTTERVKTSFWIDAFDTAHVMVIAAGDVTTSEIRETALERMCSELWGRGAMVGWTPDLELVSTVQGDTDTYRVTYKEQVSSW